MFNAIIKNKKLNSPKKFGWNKLSIIFFLLPKTGIIIHAQKQLENTIPG